MLLQKIQGKYCKACKQNKIRIQKQKINFIGYPNMEIKLCAIMQKYNLHVDLELSQDNQKYFFLDYDDFLCLECLNYLKNYLVICQTCGIYMLIRKNNMFDFEFEVDCQNCFRKFCRQCNQFRELYQSDGENSHRICFFKNIYYCSKTNIIINILDYLRFIQLLLINSLALSYNIINQYSRFWSKTYKLFRCTLLLLFYFPLSLLLLLFLIFVGTLGFLYSIRYRYDFKYLALQLIDEEYYLDYIL
ncbi:hypothetical protein pb186bvf_016909 [Paramecium bursaria]